MRGVFRGNGSNVCGCDVVNNMFPAEGSQGTNEGPEEAMLNHSEAYR